MLRFNIMTIFNFLEAIGGLSLFMFGLNVLRDSLTKISGGRMEHLLTKLSSSKFKALLLGVVVTAVIQSSTVTTIMVVALVNSGVITLAMAAPIMIGANIGTTVTGWILSLTGISGDNFWLQMLKPSSFTPILAFLGAALAFTSKKDSRKNIGTAFLGFAVMMFGMMTMSGSVTPLRESPNFQSAFQVFTNPILGVIAGAVLTAIIQSSSAVTGILQALSTTGAITFASAIPLIMGSNIGTCLTTVFSSIGGSKNAKRASFIHLSFNVLGTIIFMILFYLIHFFMPFPFYNDQVSEMSIAAVSTIFNVVSAIFFYSLSNQLVKLSCFIIPDKEPKIKKDDLTKNLRLLDALFLDRPGVAIEQAYTVTNKMMETATATLHNAIDLLFDFDSEKYLLVENLENEVDQYEDALMEYTTKIHASVLNQADNHKLTIMMHTLNDIERISDYAINIADQAKIKAESKIPFSDEAMEELKVYTTAVEDIMAKAKLALSKLDLDIALEVQPIEDVVDRINKKLSDRHIERLQNGICEIENGITIVEIYNCLERIADHCNNMSVCIIQFSEQHFRQHDFEERYDKTNPKYQKMYEHYKEKYQLPEKVKKNKKVKNNSAK